MHRFPHSTALEGVEMGPNGLRVHFKSGRAYDYPDLDGNDMHAIIRAGSPGGFFSRHYANQAEAHLVEEDERV